MVKKILLIFSLLYINSYSYVERNKQFETRGLELIRESNINQNIGQSKESGSTQIIDTYIGNGKFPKTKGFMLGTTSNFLAYPNITTGVTVSYEKYKPNESNYWGRDYNLNTYFSYELAKNLFTIGFGYSQARHVEKRMYMGTLEYGRFLTPNTYLYVNIEGQNRIYKGENSKKLRFLNYKLGILRQDIWKKLKFLNGLELNIDNKRYDKRERDTENLTFMSRISYYIYDDLLIDVQYRGVKNRKFYDNIFGIGFTHYF